MLEGLKNLFEVALQIAIAGRAATQTSVEPLKKEWDSEASRIIEKTRSIIDKASKAKPAAHGYWKEEAYMRKYYTRVTCTNCGETYGVGDWTVARFRREIKFCPNCGAEMDLKEGQP